MRASSTHHEANSKRFKEKLAKAESELATIKEELEKSKARVAQLKQSLARSKDLLERESFTSKSMLSVVR